MSIQRIRVRHFHTDFWIYADLKKAPAAGDLAVLLPENSEAPKTDAYKGYGYKGHGHKNYGHTEYGYKSHNGYGEKEYREAVAGRGNSSCGLVVDGKYFPASTPLAECQIFEGSKIQSSFYLEDSDSLPESFQAQKSLTSNRALILAVTGGIDSGKWVKLGSSPVLAGRSPVADLAISCPGSSPRHLMVHLDSNGNPRIMDLDSHNGIWINEKRLNGSAQLKIGDRIRTGNSFLCILRTPQTASLPKIQKSNSQRQFGHIQLKRTSQTLIENALNEVEPALLAPPLRSQKNKSRIPFSWAAVAAPVLFGCIMALLFNPYMALFALMSPLMAIGSWLESKFRGRKARIQLSRTSARELKNFQESLSLLRAEEIQRRKNKQVNPLEALWRIQHSEKIWERRDGQPDFFHAILGSYNPKWLPEMHGRPGQAELQDNMLPEALKILEKLAPLQDVPLQFQLGGQTLGIAGHREISLQLVRWLVIQSALFQGPADLIIQADCGLGEPESAESSGEFSGQTLELPEEWKWISWLPHCFDNADVDNANVRSASVSNVNAGNASIDNVNVGNKNRTQLLIADSWYKSQISSYALSQPESGTIVLAPRLKDLPPECTSIIKIIDSAGNAEILNLAESASHKFRIDGISKSYAKNCAQKMARYADPENAADSRLPAKAYLGEITKLENLNTESQIGVWQNSRKLKNLRASIGISKKGVLVLDLVKDGPHGLIAGTTGSGKSELLRTLVASLAHTASADLINFVLIDYKGGSAFDACVGLPHIAGIVTDLDPSLSQRALISLKAELIRREKILRKASAEDIDSYSGSLPRLLIIIDEFASMAEELPEFLNSLVETARRGRSLGVHLILATQRPGGAVNSNIRANTNFRISLRTLSEADSMDVLESPDAAFLPRQVPGRACIKLGNSPLRIFQSAQASQASPWLKEPVLISNSGDFKTAASSAAASDIQKIIQTTQKAHKQLGLANPHKPWQDPLPKFLDINSLSRNKKAKAINTINIGLVDIPEKQSMEPLEWNLAGGNLGLVGPRLSEWLASLAILAARHIPNLHIYILDSGHKLDALSQLPQCCGVFALENAEMISQLLDILSIRLKSSPAQTENSAIPPENPIMVLSDNIEGLFTSLESDRNYARQQQLEQIIMEGTPRGIYWALGLNNPAVSKRRLIKMSSMQIFSGLKSSAEYLEAGIVGNPVLQTEAGINPEKELLGNCSQPGHSGKEAKIATLKNFKSLHAEIQKICRKTKKSAYAPRLEALPSLITMQEVMKMREAMEMREVMRMEEAMKVQEAEAARPSTAKIKTDAGVNFSGKMSPVLAFGITKKTEDPRAFEAAAFDLSVNRHLLIAGPPKSGKTTSLLSFAESGKKAGALITAICSPESPLNSSPAIQICARSPADLDAKTQPAKTPVLILIDNAHLVRDEQEILYNLAADEDNPIHILAAGKNDILHRYSQRWFTEVRSSKAGLLLNPDPIDGELFGIRLHDSGNTIRFSAAGRALMVSPEGVRTCQTALPCRQMPSDARNLKSPHFQKSQA